MYKIEKNNKIKIEKDKELKSVWIRINSEWIRIGGRTELEGLIKSAKIALEYLKTNLNGGKKWKD